MSAMYGGFFANTTLIPKVLSWIQWISFVRWAFSGFMVAWIRDLTFDPPQNISYGYIRNGTDYVNNRLGFKNDSYARSLGILFAMVIILQLLGVSILSLNKARWLFPKSGVPKVIVNNNDLEYDKK